MPLRFLALLLLAAFNLHAQSPIGIGIHYAMSDSTHTYIVREVIAGNAGADAGLRRGDQLLAINGVPLAGQQTDAITRLFRGEPEGAAYKLTIRRTILSGVRAGERDIDLQVTPRAVVTPQACLSGDCKNGTGVYLDQATGRRLEGLFADGKLQQGKVFFASGRLWKEGSYKDGRLDGPDCTEYHDTTGNPVFRKGRFENGYLREGSMYSADKRYAEEGAWDEQGKRHGAHIKLRNGGFRYEGEAQHGDLTGYAESMSWEGGDYTGPVVKGLPEGKGKLVTYNTTFKGAWVAGKREGKFTSVMKDGHGGRYDHVIYYRNGVVSD